MHKTFFQQCRTHIAKIIGGIVSFTIIFVLYTQLNIGALIDVFRNLKFWYLLLVLILFFAVQLLSAIRWKIMARSYHELSFLDSIKLTASCGSLNIILPSKMGHFAKAYFMAARNHAEPLPAISMVVYEKLSDLSAMSLLFVIIATLYNKYNSLIGFAYAASLIILICFGLLHFVNIFDNRFVAKLEKIKICNKIIDFGETIFLFQKNPRVSKTILIQTNLITIVFWMVHTSQIVLFFFMLGLKAPVLMIGTSMLCAIFFGLLPISIAGIGTRDLAIVYLFQGVITYSEAISIGMLTTFRYILSALIGLPFFVQLMFSKEYDLIIPKGVFTRNR